MRDFQAALFDMDGTLIDSMGVWARVDDDFFRARGMETPPDYGSALSGKSFRESAEYTKARFCLPESTEAIIDEWNKLCQWEYANNIVMKPGAREYLAHLKAKGVRLAVATALPEKLYMPALKNNRAEHFFDAFCSTEETDCGKRGGEVYLLAARKLNVQPEDCAVFEDVYEGLLGAKAAGMLAVCVRDPAAKNTDAQNRAICDLYIEDYRAFLP